MVYLQALFCTLIIDVHEGRGATNLDVYGSYLHADILKDKRFLMNSRREFVDIMCQSNLDYEQHVRYENGVNFLYLLVLRAIYG